MYPARGWLTPRSRSTSRRRFSTCPHGGMIIPRSVRCLRRYIEKPSVARTRPRSVGPCVSLAPPLRKVINRHRRLVTRSVCHKVTSGAFAGASATCATRSISGADLTDCQMWLKAIPTQIFNFSNGLATLQFQSVSINPLDPLNDIIGGMQDNGTRAFSGKGAGRWLETVGGDGGQSGVNVPENPDAFLYQRRTRRELQHQRSPGMGVDFGSFVRQRRSRVLLCAADRRSESAGNVVRWPSARMANSG